MKITVSYLENNIGKAIEIDNVVYGSLKKEKNKETSRYNLLFDLHDGRKVRVLNFTAFVAAFNNSETKGKEGHWRK